MSNLPFLVLILTCICVYGIAASRLFQRSENTSAVQPLIVLLFAGLLARTLWCSWWGGTTWVWQLVGGILGWSGLGLFAWAYGQHRGRKPDRAFTASAPEFLITTGPYRWVRHPIYTAYLLSLLGLVIGTADGFAAANWGVILVLYIRAAWQEERLMMQSIHTETYRTYRLHTGLLLPLRFR